MVLRFMAGSGLKHQLIERPGDRTRSAIAHRNAIVEKHITTVYLIL